MPHYTRELTKTLPAGAAPRLDLRIVSGSVSVRGEDRGDVQVLAKVRFRAAGEDEATAIVQAVEDGIYADGDGAFIRTPDVEGGSFFGPLRHVFGRHRHIEIDVDVSAPRGCSLSLHHVNGPVELRGIGGDARLHMVNGRFDIEDVGGHLTLHHVNGRGLVRNVVGSVTAHHTNGAIDVERAGGDVDLHIVNGSVEVSDAGAGVSIKGISGAYALAGAIRGDVSISNAHGKITLRAPRDSRFRLDAQSAMGSVTSELDVREGDGAAGPAPHVKLRTETGSIEIKALRVAEPAGV